MSDEDFILWSSLCRGVKYEKTQCSYGMYLYSLQSLHEQVCSGVYYWVLAQTGVCPYIVAWPNVKVTVRHTWSSFYFFCIFGFLYSFINWCNHIQWSDSIPEETTKNNYWVQVNYNLWKWNSYLNWKSSTLWKKGIADQIIPLWGNLRNKPGNKQKGSK